MKLNKLILLILILLLSTSFTHAFERTSILATATVIPSLGVMPTMNKPIGQTRASAMHNILVEKSDINKLFIQAPKNSALLIHVENVRDNNFYKDLIVRSTGSQTYIESLNNSVSDIYVIELSPNQTPRIVTIITSDN